MKLTMAQMKGAIELKADGAVTVEGKPMARIAGADFLDAEGKTVVSVLADGTLRMDGSGKSAKFDSADAVVVDDGSKLTVGDDGVVMLFRPDGKVDSMSGKMKLVGFRPVARRAASVLVMAFFLLQDRAAGAATAPPAAGPGGH
jgi:flagellar basal body rod protein FlgF